MEDNKAFAMKVKANDGTYNTLVPDSVKQQVIDWGLGEIYGPYNFTLTAQNWFNNTQAIQFEEVTSNDKPICTKVLNGTKEQMIAQDKAYSLLDDKIGIQSVNGVIKFTCAETPKVDFEVQVWWSR